MGADVLVRNAWYVAGRAHEFPSQRLQGQVIAEKPLVLWRTATGTVVAFDERCCHKRMPLSAGRLIDTDLLECAYHGLCYDAAGQCVRVPSHPDGRIPPQASLRRFPVIEQDGLVWVWTGDPARAEAVQPPRLPEIAEPEWETADTGPMAVPANSLLLIENLLDISHFYPLHDGNIGDVENSRIPVELDEGFRNGNPYVGTIRRVRGYRQPPFLEDYLGHDVVDRDHTHYLLSPAVTRVQMRVWPAGRHGEQSAERGYIIVHTHTGRPPQPCVAADHQHAGRAEMQIRSVAIGDRTVHGDFSRRHRRGPLGARKTAGDVRLPGRRLSRGIFAARPRPAPGPGNPHRARGGGAGLLDGPPPGM